MDGKPREFRGAVWCALAIASKWPFAIGGLAMIAALGWRWKSGRMPLTKAIRNSLMFVALVPGLLVIIAPYLLIDHATVLRDIGGEAQMRHLGATGGGPLSNAWWYVSGPLATAFGPIGLMLCVVGAWTLRRNTPARVLLWPLMSVFFAVIICQYLVWERWILPLLPLLAVFGGVTIVGACRIAAPRIGAVPATVLVLVGVCLPLLLADAGAARARANNTAQQASAWAINHIPPGSTILVEHFGFDLLARPWHLLFPFGEIGCVDPRHALDGKIDHHTIAGRRGTRANIDYGTVGANRRSTCAADYAILTQFDRYSAEPKNFPKEYAAYLQLIKKGHIVANFYPKEGISGGRTVRIIKFHQLFKLFSAVVLLTMQRKSCPKRPSGFGG